MEFRRWSTGLLAAVILGGIFSIIAAAALGEVTRVPSQRPSIRGTEIACFEKKMHRFVAKVEPWHCEFKGPAEFEGYLDGRPAKNVADGSIVRIAVEGEWERIEWPFGWGDAKAFGNQAVSSSTGSKVSLHVFRRVRCADGSTWYSRADIFNRDNGYEFLIRLPVCGQQPAGTGERGIGSNIASAPA